MNCINMSKSHDIRMEPQSDILDLAQEPQSDILDLAQETRKHQGCHECEVNFGTEADLHQHKTRCTKNPGHQQFIPVNDFTISHLPARYQEAQLVKVIQLISRLTVLLTVSHISDDRPEFFPFTDTPYPFFKSRGSQIFSRTGTGRCVDFYKRTAVNNEPCKCKVCRTSGKPVMTWAAVIIHTATHVVFDEKEAEHTTCRLFYDTDSDQGLTLDVVGVVGKRADVSGDRCLLTCATHDLTLVDSLWRTARTYRDLFRQVTDKVKDFKDENRLTVIVSHPHGCSKQVTVGEWTQMTPGSTDHRTVQVTYTTGTCPGSSGAPVFILGQGNEWWSHTHSGASSGGNISSTIYIQ